MNEEVRKNEHLRGLAAMSKERRREIASKGGRMSQARGTARQWAAAEASAAGKRERPLCHAESRSTASC